MTHPHPNVAPGDVVQIIQPDRPGIDRVFAEVEEVKSWGVLADVPMVEAFNIPFRVIPMRLTWDQFARVGPAPQPSY